MDDAVSVADDMYEIRAGKHLCNRIDEQGIVGCLVNPAPASTLVREERVETETDVSEELGPSDAPLDQPASVRPAGAPVICVKTSVRKQIGQDL